MYQSLNFKIRLFRLLKWSAVSLTVIFAVGIFWLSVKALERAESIWSQFDPDQLQIVTIADLPIPITPEQEIWVSPAGSRLSIEMCCIEFSGDLADQELRPKFTNSIVLPESETNQWWTSNLTYQLTAVDNHETIIRVRLNQAGQSKHEQRTENTMLLPFVFLFIWFLVDLSVGTILAHVFQDQQQRLEGELRHRMMFADAANS